MAWNAAKSAAAKAATWGGAGVAAGGGGSSYPWREKLCKYKDELAKGVWGYWHLDAWKPLAISARRRARLRKEVLLAGEDWPYDPPRKEMRNKRKGHKCDRVAAEKRENTAELMRKMPQMLLDYKKLSRAKSFNGPFYLRGPPPASPEQYLMQLLEHHDGRSVFLVGLDWDINVLKFEGLAYKKKTAKEGLIRH